VDRADRSTATVRNASRMARRMASSRANVNDIFPSFLPVCHIGEERRSASVGEHLLDVLGIQPAQGRLFAAGETNASGPLPPPIAILSYELWQAAFDGRPIIRQTVEVDGRLHEVIGIMPPGADVMDNRTEIWLPLGLPHREYRAGDHFLSVIGRLRNGVTLQSAQSELNTLLENWGDRVGVRGVGVAGHFPTNHLSCPHGHSALCRASCRHSGGLGPSSARN